MTDIPDPFARQHALRQKPTAELTDAELVELLAARYASEPVPPCRVCGGVLSIASCGGGRATEYACSDLEDDPDDPDKPGALRRKAGRGIADDHYSQSRWTHYQPGDAAVQELLARFQALKVAP